MTTWRLFPVGLLGCALVACQPSSDSTKIIVSVHSDLGVPGDIDSIRLDLTSDDRQVTPSPTFQLTSPSSLPVSLAIVPAKGKDATFTVKAVALKKGLEVVSQVATSKFIAGKVGYIEMSLTSSCISKLCPSQTCSRGLCVDPQKQPTLNPLDGGTSSDASFASDALVASDLAAAEDGGSVTSKDVGGDLGPAQETGLNVAPDGGATPDSPVFLDTDFAPDSPVILPKDTGVALADAGVDTVLVVPPDTAVVPTDAVVIPVDATVPFDNAAPDTPLPVVDALPLVDTALPVADAPSLVDAPGCTPVLSLTARGEDGAATLQWSGPSASPYQIWRGLAAAGPFTTIGSTAVASFTDSSGLPNGKSVFYQVSMGSGSPACDNASNVAEAIPCAPPLVTPTTFGDDVTLRWADTGASLYAIAYGASESALSTTVTTGALSYTIANLPKNQPLYARVSSNNPTCSAGDSQVVSITPTGCIAWPSKPVLTPTLDSGQLVLNWSDSTGGTSPLTYALSFSTTPGGPYTVLSSAATSGYVHDNLVNQTAYSYVLTATDSLGCVSPTSDELTATPTLAECKALACEDFSTPDSDSWVGGSWKKSGETICYDGSSLAATGDHGVPGTSSMGSAQTIQARIKLGYCTSATDNAGAGLEVRAGSSNFYSLTLDCDGVLRLRREYTVVTDCEYTLPSVPLNTWSRLKLVVAGTTLSGYLDDMATPKFTCTDSHNLTGNPGIRWRLGSTKFCADDIRVTSP